MCVRVKLDHGVCVIVWVYVCETEREKERTRKGLSLSLSYTNRKGTKFRYVSIRLDTVALKVKTDTTFLDQEIKTQIKQKYTAKREGIRNKEKYWEESEWWKKVKIRNAKQEIKIESKKLNDKGK